VRVVVAEDVLLTRAGIVRLLQDAGIDVVGEAADRPSLLAAVATTGPDVAVTDIRMPPTHRDEGLTAAAEIRERYPGTAVLLLSQYVESRYALHLLRSYPGGIGYLLKERVFDIATVLDALHRVAEGECVVDPTIIARLMARPRPASDRLTRLTPRERVVLAHMAEGRSNEGIASALCITQRTVETHIGEVFAKLGLDADATTNRRVLAALAYLKAEPPPE
jgi:DNA-binding NarL/FixJ family response regulator